MIAYNKTFNPLQKICEVQLKRSLSYEKDNKLLRQLKMRYSHAVNLARYKVILHIERWFEL